MLRNAYSTLSLALALSLLAGCKVPTKGAPSAPSTTYTITYDANGATSGTVPTDGKQYRANESVTVQGNPGSLTRVGWIFRGWATTEAATTAEYQAGNKFKITKSLTLYAVWRGETYTINFDKNHRGAGGTQASKNDAVFGASVTLPAATTFRPPPGMRFLGWATSPTGTAIGRAYNPDVYSATVTLYALWGDAAYTISFDSNGGGGTQTSQSAVFGTSVTLPTTTTFTPPSGMRFLGWAETSSGTAIGRAYNPDVYSATVTLYAVWEGRPYTISFNSNGGRGTQADKSAVFGTPVTLPATTTFTPPSGMRFLGWAESSTGTVIVRTYSPTVYSATVTFYAKWVRKTIAGNKAWRSIAMSSDGQKIAAVVRGGHIYTSSDGGATWTERTSAGNKAWRSIAMSSNGQKIAAGVWGGYIYTSSDGGATWTERTSAGIGYWISIAMSRDGTKLATVSPFFWGYRAGRVWNDTDRISLSYDGGASWGRSITFSTHTSSVKIYYYWRSIAMSSDGTKLAAVPDSFNSSLYIGRFHISENSGASWSPRLQWRARWASVAMSSDGQKIATVEYGGHLRTSYDGGTAWRDHSGAGSVIAGDRTWEAIAMSSDGQKIAAMVEDGHIYTGTVSEDGSTSTWTDRSTAGSAIAGNKTWEAIAMSSDGQKIAAVVQHGHLYTSSDEGATWVDRSK